MDCVKMHCLPDIFTYPQKYSSKWSVLTCFETERKQMDKTLSQGKPFKFAQQEECIHICV